MRGKLWILGSLATLVTGWVGAATLTPQPVEAQPICPYYPDNPYYQDPFYNCGPPVSPYDPFGPFGPGPERPMEARCNRPVPLRAVGSSSSEVIKRVSAPSALSLGIARNNWNTDFVVPPGMVFTGYRVNMLFRNRGTYSIEMYLKYGDRTNDSFFDNERYQAEDNQLLQRMAYPRLEQNILVQPFQVNVKAGNFGTMNNTYVVSVDGCR